MIGMTDKYLVELKSRAERNEFIEAIIDTVFEHAVGRVKAFMPVDADLDVDVEIEDMENLKKKLFDMIFSGW
jgi:hypothetical protein